MKAVKGYRGVYENPTKKRGVTLFIRFRRNGQAVTERVGVAKQNPSVSDRNRNDELDPGVTYKDAERLYNKRIAQIDEGKDEILKVGRKKCQAMTLEQAWEVFQDYMNAHGKKGLKSDQSRYNVLRKVWGSTPLDQIGPNEIESQMKIWRKKVTKRNAPLSNATIAHYLKLISRIFNKVIEKQLYHGDNPVGAGKMKNGMKRIPVPTQKALDNRKERYVPPEEMLTVLDMLRNRNRIAFVQAAIALYTGARSVEIVGNPEDPRQNGLFGRDINWGSGMLKLTGKGGKTRWIPVSEDLRKILRSVHIDRNMKIAGDRIQRTAISKVFKELELNTEETPDKERVSFHSFRHAFAHYFLSANGNLRVLQDLMGHEDLATTALYLNALPYGKREGVEGVAGLIRDAKKTSLKVA